MQVEFVDGKAIMSQEDFLKYFGAEQQPKVIANVPKETSLALEITDTLSSLGIPRGIKGFEFLREAITMAIENVHLIDSITKELYPAVAQKYSTQPNRAERAMRHAIETGFAKKPEEFEVYFSHTGKPTNGEFIATVADNIRLRRPGGATGREDD